MVKILAIGDFHGKFPGKLKKEAKKCDLILSVGDYFPFSLRKLFFKYSDDDRELWEIIGKPKVKRLILKDLKSGERVLNQLNNLGVPVITVIGNSDYTHVHDVFDDDDFNRKNFWKWEDTDFFSPMIRKYKNIKRFDYDFLKLDDLIFIGAYGHTFPGHVKSKNFKKYKKILERLFNKFKKENKNHKIIFVSHNVPYNTKMGKINSKSATREMQGIERGSKLIRKIIDRYHPILHVCGHMHEHQGKCFVGKTLVVNPGAAEEGKAAIIDYDEINSRVKRVRFIK